MYFLTVLEGESLPSGASKLISLEALKENPCLSMPAHFGISLPHLSLPTPPICVWEQWFLANMRTLVSIAPLLIDVIVLSVC